MCLYKNVSKHTCAGIDRPFSVWPFPEVLDLDSWLHLALQPKMGETSSVMSGINRSKARGHRSLHRPETERAGKPGPDHSVEAVRVPGTFAEQIAASAHSPGAASAS